MRYASETAAAMALANTRPSLKYQRWTEKDRTARTSGTDAQRSAEIGKPDHEEEAEGQPDERPVDGASQPSPRASGQATSGPTQALTTRPARSMSPAAVCPALPVDADLPHSALLVEPPVVTHATWVSLHPPLHLGMVEEECLGFVIRRYGAPRNGCRPSERREEQSAGLNARQTRRIPHHRLIGSIGGPSHLGTSRASVTVLYPD